MSSSNSRRPAQRSLRRPAGPAFAPLIAGQSPGGHDRLGGSRSGDRDSRNRAPFEAARERGTQGAKPNHDRYECLNTHEPRTARSPRGAHTTSAVHPVETACKFRALSVGRKQTERFRIRYVQTPRQFARAVARGRSKEFPMVLLTSARRADILPSSAK